ncbi:hypothetical protein K1728_12060 (plasmid) [Weissella confusa]|uniref:hypothetical protein n=1 Tax=Weissella confusa TaxID=1583 RepID=UPI001C6F9740|nr:hypothetical protein [Weissella confusa]QYU58986.1 hypothetical protein K1728_12135 [Weissella confusa]QYU58998.1 hypothetical protein K1728_12060 [Weissella confusa]
MDIEAKQRKVKWELQKEFDTEVNAWKEIPSNEIPQGKKDWAIFLRALLPELNQNIADYNNQRTVVTIKKSEDLFALNLLSEWLQNHPVISDHEKKKYAGTAGTIRLALDYFVENVVMDIDNFDKDLDYLSRKLTVDGVRTAAVLSKFERRIRDMENELGFLVALSVESSTMPKGDLRHLQTDLDRDSFSNEIYNTFRERRGNDKRLLSRKRNKDQLR